MAKETNKDNKPAKAQTPAAIGGAGGAGTGAGEPANKKNSPMKVGIMLLVVLILEAGTVILTMYLSGGPSKAKAHEVTVESTPPDEELVELAVVKEQFPNQKTGKVMVYETEIFITVKKKDADKLKKQIEAMQAQLSTELATIFRRAEPAHFLEPTLATLTRQVKAGLSERLGKDGEGNVMVQEVFIKKCLGFQAG